MFALGFADLVVFVVGVVTFVVSASAAGALVAAVVFDWADRQKRRNG